MSLEKSTFDSNMMRLKNVFGEKNYPKEREMLIYSSLKEIKGYEFTQLISYLIAKNRQYPLIDDFKKALATIRDFNIMRDKAADRELILNNFKGEGFEGMREDFQNIKACKSIIRCEICEDSGLVYAKSKKNGNEYCFKCCCDTGKTKYHDYKYPDWNDKLLVIFNLPNNSEKMEAI